MLFLYVLFFHFLNFAQVGTTADSLGGAGVARSHMTEAAFLNPAGLGFFSNLEFASAYVFGKTRLGDLRQLNVVFADGSSENFFLGSVAYKQKEYTSTSALEIHEKEFIANAAFRLRPELSVGLRGYKVQTEPVGGVEQSQYNSDIGVQWIMNKKLSLGMTQVGILSAKESLIFPLGVLPRTTVGAQYIVNSMLIFTGDLVYAYNQNPHKRFTHSAGISLTHLEYFRLNAGGRFDDRAGETAYTAGVQFCGPQLKVGYAYQKEVRQRFGEIHTIDISLNF